MLREHVELIRSSLVVADSHSASMRIYRCTQRGTLLRLLAGIYIPRSLLEGRSPVDFREITFIARVCALGLRYPDYVISGAVAAYILDLPCESRIERLTLYTPSRQCPNLVHFPEIVIDDNIRIPSVRVRTCRPSHPVSSIEYLGFRIATPARVLVDCARLLSDKRGFPVACAGLARACHFDRFHQEASRDHEDKVRRKFHEALADTPRNARGRGQARWIIDHADAGCESPGEALVLLALLRAGIVGISTQEEVHIDSRTYFIDIALPDLKIAIEFDGRIKYGETVDQVHDSIEAEQRRQRDLERAGWKVIRVRWSDLTLIDEVVAQVLVTIRSKVGR